MKAKVIVILIGFNLACGAISARANQFANRTQVNDYPKYSYSWADFAGAMQVLR
jgi:hypothetical protein